MPAPNLTTIDRVGEIEALLLKLSKTSVMVGVPSDTEQHFGGTGTDQRTGTTINNASLAYIHENGSPVNNIPPRPFLNPGVANSKEAWSKYLNQASSAALSNNGSVMDRALHAAGMTAVQAVKSKITSGLQPPLKPATIAARRRRTPSRKAVTAADVRPLIDTGQLLNSISYVIRKGK